MGANLTQEYITVNLTSFDRFNGIYGFQYMVESPFKGQMFVRVFVLDSERAYNASGMTDE